MKLYIDESGIYRATCTEGQELLASYLEEDIQSSVASCDIILQILLDVEQGTRQPFDAIGNAHSVFIQSDWVQIENLWLEPPVPPLELTTDQFRQALLKWRTS